MKETEILYLKEENFISIVFYKESKKEIYSIKSEVNNLAKKHFFSLLEYRKLVRRELGLKNKIPIYFSKTLLLFYLKCNNAYYYLNFFNILKICYEDKIFIIFKDGTILKLDISKQVLQKELQKIKKVLSYINSL